MDLHRLFEEINNSTHCYTDNKTYAHIVLRYHALGSMVCEKNDANCCEKTLRFRTSDNSVSFKQRNDALGHNLLVSIWLKLLKTVVLLAIKFIDEELLGFISEVMALTNDGYFKHCNCFVESNQEANYFDELYTFKLMLLLRDHLTKLLHGDALSRDDQQPKINHSYDWNSDDKDPILCHRDQLNRVDQQPILDHSIEFNRIDQQPILDHSIEFNRIDQQPILDHSIEFNRIDQQPILDHYDESNRVDHQPILDHSIEFNRIDQQPILDHCDESNRVDHQPILNHSIEFNRNDQQPILDHSIEFNRNDQQPILDHSIELNRIDQQPILHQTVMLCMNGQQLCVQHCNEDCVTLLKAHCDVHCKVKRDKKQIELHEGTFKQNQEQLGPIKCVVKAHLDCVDKCEDIEYDGVKKYLVSGEHDDVQLCKDKLDLPLIFDRSSVRSITNFTKRKLRDNGKETSLLHGQRIRNELIGFEENVLNDLLKGIHFRIQPQELQVYMVPGISLPHPSVVCGMLWHMFKREVNRIRTFAKYPISAPKSSLMLASEGFIYIGNGGNLDDHVICYFCCRQKKNWQPLDSIGVVHRELSPDCPMLTGISCENEPIGTQRSTLSYVTNVNTQKSNVTGAIALSNASKMIEADSIVETSQPSNGSYRAPPRRTNRTQLATQSIPRPMRQTALPLVQPPVNSGTQSSHEGNSIALPSNSSYNNLSSIPVFPAIHDLTQPPFSQSASAHVSISQTIPDNPVSAQRENVAPSLALAASTPSGSDAQRSSSNVTISTQEVVASAAATAPVQTLTDAAVSGQPGQDPNSRIGQANTAGNTPTSTSNAKGPTYSELGIITERPKRTEYAPKISRLRTFDNWPRDHHLTPEQLSEAGFYYAGYGDCARCFFCGGGLRNWEDEDDVWVEHARWFPKCAYIRQQMGQVFVDTVQELNKQYTVITYQMVINRTGQPSMYNLDSKESPLKNDAAVKTLVALGYAENDVLCAAKLVKEEFSLVSSDSILERLNKDGCRRVNAPKIVAPLTVSNPNETLEKMRTLKEKNNQLRQQTVCKICMDKEVAVLFLPCGHLISCAECASAMKDCPVCRKPVKGVVRAFIS